MILAARGVVSQAQISIAGVTGIMTGILTGIMTGIMGDGKTGIYCRRVGLLRI